MLGLDLLYKEAIDNQANVINKCVVGKWASSMDDANLSAFTESLNDDDFSTRSLFSLYKNAGATFGLTSLREHRRGVCTCR